MAEYTINSGYEFSQDLEYGDSCTVNSGGTLSHLKIDSGAKVIVNNGGIIDDATHFWGDLIVSSGGMMKNTNLKGDGAYVRLYEAVTSNVIISSGAIMSARRSIQDRTTVKMGGKLKVENRIRLVGELTLEDGADFSPVGGGTQVIFDYTSAFSSSSTPYINDISRVPDTFSYSVEFLNLPELGSYTLAGNAADFDGSITVKCGGQDDVTVTVGGPVVPGYYNQAYSLAVSEDNQLVFSVLGLDTFVNSDWTEADVMGSIIEDTELVWQKNAFNTLPQAASLVGSTNTLYIGASTTTDGHEEINLTGPSNVWILAGTFGTILYYCSFHGNGGTLHVDNDLLIHEFSGFSRVDIMGCSLFPANGFKMPDNSILNFDVTKRNVNDNAMLSKMSQQHGNLTITISADQREGSYALSGDAKDLNGHSITLFGENNQQLGTLTVGGSDMVIGAKAYSLALNTSNTLIFSVKSNDTTPPDAPVAEASTTLPTNQNVTVTATFSTDSTVKEYSMDGTNWSAYTGGIVFFENGTVSFRGTDAAGNFSDVTSVAVTNIDKVPPDSPEISTAPEPGATTNGNVQVTAYFPNDVVLTQVSLDGVEWNDSSHNNVGQIEMTDNGWVYFRGFDAAGNFTEASHEVTNIDKVAPEAPEARADVTGPTNQNVTVTATFSDDSAVKEYSTDGANWNAYTEGIVMSENGTVSFRGTDAEGNVSDVTDFVVANIDKIAPDAPLAEASTTAPTNQDVTVTATFSTDSTVKEYSMDGTNWSAYTEGIVFSENGTVSFRGTDAAGNVSEVTNFVVGNIDKVAPNAPSLAPDITTPTNGNVTVVAIFPNDAIQRQVSLDGVEWHGNNEQIVMTNNGWVYYRGIDAAGNISDVASYQVTNIDRIIPDAPVARADVTGPTNQNVTVTATFSNDSTVKEYSTDGTNWSAYTEGIVFSENGTVSFRGTDAAGNVSDVTSYAVTNIDKVPPTAPVAEADVTVPINQDVTVTATFSTDSTVKEYSTDGTNWSAYTEGIVLSENGTVSFRGTDEAGNLSEVTDFVVANIDKVAPTVVSVEASETQPTNQDVVVTTAFTDNVGVALIQYWVYEGEWMTYSDGVTMDRNGAILFRAIDTAGNVSDTARLEVANIDKVPPDAPAATADGTWTLGNVTVTATFSDDSVVRAYSLDGADWSDYSEGIVFSENGTVFFRGTDEAGNDSEVTSYTVGNIVAPIVLDGCGSGTLTADLPVSGAYGITGEFGDITGTVTIYNGGKKVGSGKVKKGVLSFNNGKAVLLDSSLETKVKVNAQRGSALGYSVTLTPEKLFPKGDNSDDWTDLATKGAEGMVGRLELGAEQSQVLSQSFNGQTVLEDWVGFGDAVDYKAFTLETAAQLSFDVTASDAAKFTIYELVPPSGKKSDPVSQLIRFIQRRQGGNSGGGKASSYSLSSKQTITLSRQKGAEEYSGSTKGLLLEAGTYYIGVESTNAKKGGDADYSVALNGSSTFFTEGDNTDDDWTAAPSLAAGDALAGWVGFGDAIDYRAVTVDARGGFYSFQLSDAENNVKLSLYSVNAKGKLVKVKSVSGSAKKPDVSTGALALAGDTQYVLAVEATGAGSAKNSHYTLEMKELGVFIGEDNNSWATATAIDGEFLGCLGKGAGADSVDYFDLSSWKDGLELEMESGKVKATFYSADHKAVKLPMVACADGKVKSNVSSLTLKDGNTTTDTIRIAAIDESVKYLKIEAEGSGLNSYRIGMLA